WQRPRGTENVGAPNPPHAVPDQVGDSVRRDGRNISAVFRADAGGGSQYPLSHPGEGRDPGPLAQGRRAALGPGLRRGDGGVASPYGHRASGGIEDRIESTSPPVFSAKIVPRS